MYNQEIKLKKYKNYYLFINDDFQYDYKFGDKIYSLNQGKFENIIFSISLPLPGNGTEGKSSLLSIPFHYSSEKLFYEVKFDNGLELNFLNHYISDESGLWEAFVSRQYELCIFGCNNDLKKSFEEIFKPYSKENLEDKYSFLATANPDFLSLKLYLENTFNLTKNSDNV